MLIPARRLSHWAAIPGTETNYAGVVPVVANRHILETAAATVVMAYPTSPRTDPQPRGIRLDFGWVVQLAFTSFWRSDPAEVAGIDTADRIFALNVLDNSPLVDQFLSGYSATEWPFDHPPKEVIRHFHVSFDDFGSYNVLAVDCAARAFSWSPSKQPPWNPGASPYSALWSKPTRRPAC
jgi:hypothetical protein